MSQGLTIYCMGCHRGHKFKKGKFPLIVNKPVEHIDKSGKKSTIYKAIGYLDQKCAAKESVRTAMKKSKELSKKGWREALNFLRKGGEDQFKITEGAK